MSSEIASRPARTPFHFNSAAHLPRMVGPNSRWDVELFNTVFDEPERLISVEASANQ
jgi:hypothetical protein